MNGIAKVFSGIFVLAMLVATGLFRLLFGAVRWTAVTSYGLVTDLFKPDRRDY